MSRYLGKGPITEAQPAPTDPERGQEPRRGKSGREKLAGCGRFVLVLLVLGAFGLLLGVVFLIGSYLYLSNELTGAIDQVVRYQGQGPGGTPRFYDRRGRLLFELRTAEKRRWLDYQDIPQDIVNATVAVEDDTYWTNPGFDAEAIVAALISNYRNPDQRPVGASTITQQLVRHIAFTYEERITASYERKVREAFLAFILTQRRSKQDIMTMYLNEIYYGNLAYGIEAAAQTYFGKSAVDLNLAQSAFLASLPQAPYELDPYTNLEGALVRQAFVLDLMQAERMIDAEQAEAAKQEQLELVAPIPVEVEAAAGVLEAPHFILYVQDMLERRYGPDALTRGGWQITTTLDLDLQRYAENAAREWIASRAAAHDVNNASIGALKPGTGEILAMVGSLDYFDEDIDGQVNVALQPRQPGSSIKPITYAAAMERGWNAGDVLWDVPIELDLGGGEKMKPSNYDGRYHGPLLFRDALANSYNIPPIQLIRDIGVPAFISTARKMGVESLTEPPGYYGLALTLGGGEVPLLEMTHAFATLANQGQRPHLTGVLAINDSRDNSVYDLDDHRLPAVNALDPRIAYIITDILDDDIARAPAMGRTNALNLPFPAAAKTGTTNDFRDNWTLGYTPGVAVGVWVGNTDGHPMRDSSGLRGAAPLWRSIIEHLYADETLLSDLAIQGQQPPDEFPMPNGLEERKVCLPRGSGGSSCTSSREDLFVTGGPVHGVQRLGYVPDVITNPGAWTLAVAPISAADARRVPQPALESGQKPPTPTQCVINSFQPRSDQARRLFLPVPPFYPDEVRARLWARQAGYSMAPPIVCPAGTARVAGPEGEGLPGASGASAGAAPPVNSTWHISSPLAGEQVKGLLPIVGTASFDPAKVQYYKLEIGSGAAPTSWTTFGTTHNQSVTNGVLETLQTDALAPGDYVIRLVIVRNDGNFPAPYAVPITVVR
ncbi:MAG: transglycosylase domain-containing protein [Chloroflexota bacterium]|nr:MAG: transglycosylase domain-containing protein [Chloroflexota bacterium]